MAESCKTLGEGKKYTIIVGKHDRGEQWREILKKLLKMQVVIL
jgi:hypothetical protein